LDSSTPQPEAFVITSIYVVSSHNLNQRPWAVHLARETVKRALELLRAERLIVSRQGSGAFVRAQTQRAVELRTHIEAAFERPHLTIDFAGFSGETLRDALAEALDRVRVGRPAPERIAVRVLISDMTVPMALPSRAETQADDPAVRERAERITSRRAADGIIDQVAELGDLGLIRSAAVEVRMHRASPLFKLYILNGEEVFYGFYPVVERTASIKGEPMAIYDLMGKDVPLFHYAVTDDDTSYHAVRGGVPPMVRLRVVDHRLPVRRVGAELGRLLTEVDAVLLDFDGPVCSIFTGYPAPQVAAELVDVLRRRRVNVPPDLPSEPDPPEVLRCTGALGDQGVTRAVEDAPCAAERQVAERAQPTPYGREVIVAARQAGPPVAVVSNNSAGAVAAYLEAHRLAGYVSPVVGRPYDDPDRMKPRPGAHYASCPCLGDVTGPLRTGWRFPPGYRGGASQRGAGDWLCKPADEGRSFPTSYGRRCDNEHERASASADIELAPVLI
ncbi:hypothetical protein SAMN05444858_101669, partial [Micromonospora avicenniae]